MSFTDDFLKELKKRGLTLEDITSNEGTGSIQNTSKTSGYTSDYFAELKKQEEKNQGIGVTRRSLLQEFEEEEDKDDIAPVRDDKKLDFFQKGAFADGYQKGDITRTILGTAGDIKLNVAKGALNVVEGIGDLATYGVAGAAKLIGADEFSGKAKEFAKTNLVDKLYAKPTEYFDKNSVLARTSDAILQGVGQVGLMIGTGSLGAGAGLGSKAVTALNTSIMGASSFGSGMGQAYEGGATDEEAVTYGAIAGASDAITELIFGGMGKSINAVGFNVGLSSADDMLAKKVSQLFTNQIAKNFAEFGVKASAEGLEEVLAGIAQAAGKKMTYMSEEEFGEILKDENLLEQFVVGVATSGFMQSGVIPGTKQGSLIEANKEGRDFITGYSQNEQAVIKKESENRIAEKEADGTKLSKKERSAIEAQVEKDMEKGYISIDTIEETLGGETYKTYKHTVDSEDAIQKEFDTLNKMKQGEMTGEQIDRRTELKEKLEYLKKKSQREQLKSKLGEEVMGLVQGDRLLESYNERSRRTEAFQADLTRYDEKQRAVVQKAAESGILNNTNRTHEFVDMVAKISADKGVLFDFTNNAKLKESGFSMEGKTINGYVSGDSIAVNIQSAKSLNTVVGHEIAHVLERTALYTELQNAVVAYAKTKGDYQSRYDTLSKLYENVEGANIDAELTADLVGDYLFTDSDFINNLSTNHRNVFQKIYDEVKYLLKVATAGSKEARELEKVKNAFEKAYRAEGKAQKDSGAKYSISDTTGRQLSQEQADLGDPNIDISVDGYYSGEMFATISYRQDGKVVGTLEYSDYEGTPHIKMIEVKPEYRRKGIGTKLLQHLQNQYPDTEIDFGMATTDGMKLLEKTTYTVENKELAEKFQRLDAVTAKLAEYDANYEKFYNEEIELPDDYAPDYEDLQWEEHNLREELRRKKRSKTLVRADAKKPIPAGDARFSLSDTAGRQLSQEQAEYFKDSKVRDENGNLKVMYHGSTASFTVFDKKKAKSSGYYGKGFYFTDSDSHAKQYGNTYDVYLNITNPLQDGTNDITRDQLRKFVEAVAENEDYGIDNYGYGATVDSVTNSVYGKSDFAMIMDINASSIGNMVEAIELFNEVNETDYNGIITPTETVAFYPNQIKSVDNAKPTGDPDIRYSISEEYSNMVDSDGVVLTKAQEAYFGENGIKDDAGNLLKLYRSADGGRTVWNGRGEGSWAKGIYLTDEAYIARAFASNGKNVGDVLEVYARANNPLIVDAQGSNYMDIPMPEDAPDWLVDSGDWEGRLNADQLPIDAFKNGYDAVIIKNVREGVGGDPATDVILRDSNQMKQVDNANPTADPNIHFSLSDEADRVFYTPSGIEVVQNPTNTEYRQMREDIYKEYPWLRGTGEAILRHTYDEAGNEYYWNAYEGMHRDVEPYINKQYNTRTSQHWEWWTRTDKDDYPTDYAHLGYSLSDTDGGKAVLSDTGAQQNAYGDYNVYGEDVALEAPVQEDVAPVTETQAEPAVNQTTVEDLFPDDTATVQEEYENLLAERDDIRGAMDVFAAVGDTVRAEQMMAEYEAVQARIAEIDADEADRLASIQDEDAPPEVDNRPEDVADNVPLTKKLVDDLTRSVRQQLGLSTKRSNEVRELIQRYSNEEFPSKAHLYTEIADRFGTYTESSVDEDLKGVKALLRTYGISVDQSIKDEIADYGHVMRRNFGKVKFSNNGLPVDVAYKEFQEVLPGYFPEDVYSPTDQLMRILEVANMETTMEAEYEIDTQTLEEVTDTIMNGVGEFKQNWNETLANRLGKESFDSLMKSGDRYVPPLRLDTAPVRVRQTRSAIESVQADPDDIAPVYDTSSGQQSILPETEAPKPETEAPKKFTRKDLHLDIMDRFKTYFRNKGFDFDKVLKNAKDLSTFATVDNTPQRVMEKALGYKEGQVLADVTVNMVAKNETEGIKWLNSFTDKKTGLLAKISKQYGIKPGSKASAAAQMYAEGFYVGENDAIIAYGDKELAADFPNVKVQENIKKLARDPRIRQIYDETLEAINKSRTRNAYPEIPRLDNYFLHFRAMEDTFSRLGLPFNPNDIRAKDLPTDLNGVTADLKPGQPYFASAMHRNGKRTSFDLLGGMERYLTSAKNQIYHIDDIQKLRALRNYVAETYGQATGLEDLDLLSDEEAELRIEQVYDSHLSTFAKFLNEEANVLAGKTSLIDRGLEGVIGRRGMTFIDTLNRQVGANMVGYNVSSSLTNFLAPVQAFAKTNKFDFVKAMAQTSWNKIASVFGRGDGFAEQSPVMIRRKGADRFYRTPYQKVADVGYVFMSVVDNISTELIARTKYNEFTRKGMSSSKAHYETDKWVSRLMGDRSLGQMPQVYNSKTLGLITKFQLEVRNQLDSQFYDTIQETKASTEDIQNGLLRNAKRAAKITSTFAQLAVMQHLFGKAFESVAGYNPAFDIIDTLIKTFGWDDEEDDEDTVLDNIEEGFQALLGDLPYTSVMTGGRIPISSALPVTELIKGVDQYGNDKNRWDTIKEAAPYYLLPGGYGQVKKTVAGLEMFDEDLPIAGSYTDSGNLRFPVEDNLQNRVKAALFGQWASENARNYFDNEQSPLKEKQVQELIDSGLPFTDYLEYRDGLAEHEKLEDKIDYIAGLDLPISTKNLLVNNVADRKNPIDLTDYDQYSSYDEFDFASKNPEKYDFLQENNISYSAYTFSDGAKEKYDAVYEWVNNYPDKVVVANAVTDNVVRYREYAKALDNIRADKDKNGKSISGSAKAKKLDYINSLDIEYGAKLILFKNEYNADDTYNYEIIDYLNGRDDISRDEMIIILRELGFTVTDDGSITW